MQNLGKRLLDSKKVARLGGYLFCSIMSRWMMTLNYRVAYYDPACDVGRIEYCEPVIYLIWHEYLTLPFFVRRNTRLALLASQHRDAEVLTQAANLYGFKVYRGSSGRGGVQALLGIMQDDEMRGLVITPDGPRGPRRRVASGAIFLASRLQWPIVLLGAGFKRPWRYTRVWDQHAFARPFSRARLIMSPKIRLPDDLNREQLAQACRSLESSLKELTFAAECWANSKQGMENETGFYPGPFGCDSRILHQRMT